MSNLRDQLRAQVFSGENKPKREPITFFGADIELVQPRLGEVLAAQANPDRESAIIDMLVTRACVPNTDERVFEDTDADSLKALPFDRNFIQISEIFEKMTEVSFRQGEGTSEEESSAAAGNEAVVGTETT